MWNFRANVLIEIQKVERLPLITSGFTLVCVSLVDCYCLKRLNPQRTRRKWLSPQGIGWSAQFSKQLFSAVSLANNDYICKFYLSFVCCLFVHPTAIVGTTDAIKIWIPLWIPSSSVINVITSRSNDKV